MNSYPDAQAVAERLLSHLIRSRQGGPAASPSAPLPDAAAIHAIIDAGFWASLRREEGRTPLLSLAYVRPEDIRHPLRFEHPVPLAPEPLSRVSPAVERPGIHLGIWGENGDLCVWGAARKLPRHCFVLEVIAPGLLIVKQNPGDDAGKFVNIAVLEGDSVKVVDQRSASDPDCPSLLTSLLGFDTRTAPASAVNVLIQIAVSMRAHGRGGTLLVVPSNSQDWRHSIVQPILYSISPPFSLLTDLVDRAPSSEGERWWQDAMRRAVDAVAGLTAVDGATIMTDRYELLAFGSKIVRRPGSAQVARVILTEPVEGSSPETVEPVQLGGTRHLSAAQFEHDQRDSIALVASQDGRFTVFAWSPCEDMVHAHRIEALLL